MVTRSEDVEHRSERLKERVYVTFTALAVVLALREHPEPPADVTVTLVIVVSGTLLASLLAEVVAHIAVHGVLPSRAEVRHALRVTAGAAGSLLVPSVFLLLSVAGVWDVERSLRAASVALVASLVAIGYLAARRVRLPWWQRALVLFGEFGLGALVLALELLAHD